jgi:adenosine deaminase
MARSGLLSCCCRSFCYITRRLQTLIDLAKEHGVELPAYTVEELRETLFHDAIGSLEKYLECFRYTTAVLQTPGALERVAYELACDNYDENVFYFEVRFAPQLHANHTMDITSVLASVNRGLLRARDEYNSKEHVMAGLMPPYEYGIIVCGMRSFDERYSAYYREFMLVSAWAMLARGSNADAGAQVRVPAAAPGARHRRAHHGTSS